MKKKQNSLLDKLDQESSEIKKLYEFVNNVNVTKLDDFLSKKTQEIINLVNENTSNSTKEALNKFEEEFKHDYVRIYDNINSLGKSKINKFENIENHIKFYKKTCANLKMFEEQESDFEIIKELDKEITNLKSKVRFDFFSDKNGGDGVFMGIIFFPWLIYKSIRLYLGYDFWSGNIFFDFWNLLFLIIFCFILKYFITYHSNKSKIKAKEEQKKNLMSIRINRIKKLNL